MEKRNKMVVELKLIPVEQINPAKYNPRKELQPTDPEYESIKQSIKAHGLADPLIWNAHNGVLIGGHQRLRILVNEFGVKEVPCSVRYITDEKEEMSLNAALNKNQGEWDFEKLKLMLFKFSEDDANDPLRAAMGFAPLEFKGILDWSPLVTSPEGLEQTPEERMGVFEAGAIKQIVLYFDGKDYAKIAQRLEAVRTNEKVEDNTTAFMRLLENYETTHALKNKPAKKAARRTK